GEEAIADLDLGAGRPDRSVLEAPVEGRAERRAVTAERALDHRLIEEGADRGKMREGAGIAELAPGLDPGREDGRAANGGGECEAPPALGGPAELLGEAPDREAPEDGDGPVEEELGDVEEGPAARARALDEGHQAHDLEVVEGEAGE